MTDRARPGVTNEELAMVGLSADHAARGGRHPLVTEIARLRAENDAQALALSNLVIAVQSSREIGCAVGILMHQRKLTSTQAFELLRQASQQTNREIRDVAEKVVLTGLLEQSYQQDSASSPVSPHSPTDGMGLGGLSA